MANDKNKNDGTGSGPVSTDINKGTQYRARTNIQLQGPVYIQAGQVFRLDDPAVEKFLLDRGTITTELKGGAIEGRLQADRSAVDFHVAHEKRVNENADRGVELKKGGEALPGIIPNNR